MWSHWTYGRRWQQGMRSYNQRYVYDDHVGYIRPELQRRSPPKSDDEFRILILGDSLTDGGLYVSVFRDALSSEYPERTFSVINAGVVGYDTELERRYLEHYGLDEQPDLIVLQFCMNDFNATPVVVKGQGDQWYAFNNPVMRKLATSPLFGYSAIYRLYAYARVAASPEPPPPVEENLKRIVRLAEEHHIPFRLLLFPPFTKQSERLTRILRIIDAQNLAGQTIDLRPNYAGIPLEDLSPRQGDRLHPTALGHRIAGRALFEALAPLLQDGSTGRPGLAPHQLGLPNDQMLHARTPACDGPPVRLHHVEEAVTDRVIPARRWT